jgi:hypothetical protein
MKLKLYAVLGARVNPAFGLKRGGLIGSPGVFVLGEC